MKHPFSVSVCVAGLVVSLTGCGTSAKAGLPVYTGGSSPSTTATSRPATTPTTTASSVDLAAHSTYTYGGLKVDVNLPAGIPRLSRASMMVFSDFLQADGRTMARNKLDPSLASLASASVVKYVRTTTGGQSVQGIGSVTFTISKVQPAGSNYTLITGCTDQSKLVQVRKDGSHYVDPNTKKFPTLKMTVDLDRGMRGPQVNVFTFAAGTC